MWPQNFIRSNKSIVVCFGCFFFFSTHKVHHTMKATEQYFTLSQKI